MKQLGAGGTCFAAGLDFFLAFSPERLDPGRADWTVLNAPKVNRYRTW